MSRRKPFTHIKNYNAIPKKYKIPPEQDQCGSYGFQKVKFCKLHNFIYKEQKKANSLPLRTVHFTFPLVRCICCY